MTLDRTDFEILRLLQENAQLMNKELAEAVGLAPSSCHERVKRLWASGVITGTQTLVDATRLGYGISAIIFVNISKDGQIAIDDLMDELIALPEVQSVHLVTGSYDLIVRVLARDTNHLKSLAYEVLTGRGEINRYETSIIYESRRGDSIPLETGRTDE